MLAIRICNRHVNSGGGSFMSIKCVYSILRIFKTTGDVKTPLAGRRRTMGRIPVPVWVYVEELILDDAALYLDEIITLVLSAFGYRLPISTLCKNLQRRGYTTRVLKQLSMNRVLIHEEEWAEMSRNTQASYFCFGDYTHQNLNKMPRRHGRGMRGQRTYVNADWKNGGGRRMSAFALICLRGKGILGLEGGILDYSLTWGNADAEMAVAMIYRYVIPHLNAYPDHNSILVLDNASYFKDLRIREMVESCGARLMFLNPYAKHENPIEESFSKKNAFLRRHRALALADPHLAVGQAFESITSADAAGYYRHAGYDVKCVGLAGILA